MFSLECCTISPKDDLWFQVIDKTILVTPSAIQNPIQRPLILILRLVLPQDGWDAALHRLRMTMVPA
jgi:hypothetical protein